MVCFYHIRSRERKSAHSLNKLTISPKKLKWSRCTDPQGTVQPDSFPRIFGVFGHAYLVYIGEFATHIWCMFTHIWYTDRRQHVDSANDAQRPIYLYGVPL